MHDLLEQVITWARALQTLRIAVGEERNSTGPITMLQLDEMCLRAHDADPRKNRIVEHRGRSALSTRLV